MKRTCVVEVTIWPPDDAFDGMTNDALADRLHTALREGFPFLRGDEIDVRAVVTARVVRENQKLRAAAERVLEWLGGMRIVRGGTRERLQIALREALRGGAA